MSLIKKIDTWGQRNFGPAPMLGFLSNFGLASFAYIMALEIDKLYELSKFWNINVFFLIYLGLYVLFLTTITKGNKEINRGARNAFLLIVLVLLINYIKLIL